MASLNSSQNQIFASATAQAVFHLACWHPLADFEFLQANQVRRTLFFSLMAPCPPSALGVTTLTGTNHLGALHLAGAEHFSFISKATNLSLPLKYALFVVHDPVSWRLW